MENTTKNIGSYLTFKMGEELFAFPVEQVIEILEVPKITHVPRSPEYMKGVINLRGNVLPLIDTRIKFYLSPIEFTINTCVVVLDIEVEGELLRIGALVDSVLEVLEIPNNQLQPSPSIDAEYPLDFIKGVFKYQDEFVMCLSIDKVFSLQNLDEMAVKH